MPKLLIDDKEASDLLDEEDKEAFRQTDLTFTHLVKVRPKISDVFTSRGYRIGKNTVIRCLNGFPNVYAFNLVVYHYRKNKPPLIIPFSLKEIKEKAWENNVKLPKQVKKSLTYLANKLSQTRRYDVRREFEKRKAKLLDVNTEIASYVKCFRFGKVHFSICLKCNNLLEVKKVKGKLKILCRIY